MKQKPQIIFIIVLGIYFLFNGCLPRNEKKDWQLYAIELQGEGWSEKASEHIAKVEFKIIPEELFWEVYEDQKNFLEKCEVKSNVYEDSEGCSYNSLIIN